MKIKELTLIALVTIWAIFIGIGFVSMADYSSRPGSPANITVEFPENLPSNEKNNLPKIFVFFHPKCPCSSATISELEHLIADTQNLAVTTVFFYKPVNESDEWVKTNLWETAKQIPTVEIEIMNEDEMSKFGVITSGQTIVYDSQDNLIFSGGITVGRGHEGESLGRKSIENYLKTGEIETDKTAVFGCILTSPETN